MKQSFASLSVAAIFAAAVAASAQTSPVPQTTVGAGNTLAASTAQASPLVNSAYNFILGQINLLSNANLRTQTYDAIANPQTCVLHRANLTAAKKHAIIQSLLSEGLLNPADDNTFPGGLVNGVFPPVLNDGTSCPQLPQPFLSAPGSGFGGHHSYPGGLPIHESNNDTADINLASEYRNIYGSADSSHSPAINVSGVRNPSPDSPSGSGLNISADYIIGAPLWHDWAKSIVFQWNADGTEFAELNIGGTGSNDNNGAPGSSATGGHHILSIAEAIKRNLPPAFIITQASAHSAPTLGNEYKVVNWIRAAAIIDQVDPVQRGYLTVDSLGHYRLAASRELGQIDLLAAGQSNLLAEYTLHNISDSDFSFSIPAVSGAQTILADLAPSYGYSTADTARYNTGYRNVVLSQYSAERIYIVYTSQGSNGVKYLLDLLHQQHLI